MAARPRMTLDLVLVIGLLIGIGLMILGVTLCRTAALRDRQLERSCPHEGLFYGGTCPYCHSKPHPTNGAS